jgi:tRNA-splicing ligase RtcB
MSRTGARREIIGAELRRSLESQGIVVRCPSNRGLAEEAPVAIKMSSGWLPCRARRACCARRAVGTARCRQGMRFALTPRSTAAIPACYVSQSVSWRTMTICADRRRRPRLRRPRRGWRRRAGTCRRRQSTAVRNAGTAPPGRSNALERAAPRLGPAQVSRAPRRAQRRREERGRMHRDEHQLGLCQSGEHLPERGRIAPPVNPSTPTTMRVTGAGKPAPPAPGA